MKSKEQQKTFKTSKGPYSSHEPIHIGQERHQKILCNSPFHMAFCCCFPKQNLNDKLQQFFLNVDAPSAKVCRLVLGPWGPACKHSRILLLE